MANAPSIDKTIVSFQLPIALKVRLEKEARRKRMSVSALVTHLINEGVSDVILTATDYENIARLVKKNEAKRKKRQP